uniref:Reverse transcriptase domain-containing protein n=1 Tax=Meloidogyne incognita TaxID=6306 RepID=A0A914NMT3_MELIC
MPLRKLSPKREQNNSEGTLVASLCDFCKDIEFSLLDIDNILKNLPNNNCCSEDGISYTLLKNCHSSITPFLSDIFRLSLDSGILPQSWKVSHITPVFKKGDKNIAANYRPISITSAICRVLERIILNSLLIHLEENKIISESQFGFLKKRSTTTQLIFTFSHWYRAILENKNVDCVYIDLKHAFDSVPIKFLIYKLFNIGVRGKLLNWISSFLTDRTAKVKINTAFSTSFKIYSGVPQGSILGPILFLIYINDLTFYIPKNVSKCLFADDLKIFQVFKNSENTNSLQNALNIISQWSSDWALEISTQKTFVLNIGSKNPKYTYTLNGDILQITSVIKDLGITITNDLSFDLHYNIIIRKAYARASSVLNSIHTSNPKINSLQSRIISIKTFII